MWFLSCVHEKHFFCECCVSNVTQRPTDAVRMTLTSPLRHLKKGPETPTHVSHSKEAQAPCVHHALLPTHSCKHLCPLPPIPR